MRSSGLLFKYIIFLLVETERKIYRKWKTRKEIGEKPQEKICFGEKITGKKTQFPPHKTVLGSRLGEDAFFVAHTGCLGKFITQECPRK